MLPPGFHLIEVIPLKVPGLEQEQRHLLRIGQEHRQRTVSSGE
jgi:hypothetical protein